MSTIRGDDREGDEPKSRQRQPQQEYKLEGEVEWEPVDNIDEALNNAVK
jgi:hypothetical protein